MRGSGAGRSSVQANHVVAATASSPALTSADRVGITGLNDDQWKTLVQMLNDRKALPAEDRSGKHFAESWIIDSGATNHTTGTFDFLVDFGDMAPVFIKLPDGRFTTSTKQGRVRLGPSLSLEQVFFVDGLQCHLIYVSQLTRNRGCVDQVTDKLCILQDRISRILIGVGEQENGLYFFRGMEMAAAIQSSSSLSADVWHTRLGHPSSKAL